MSRILFSALGPSIEDQCESLGIVATGNSLEIVDRISHGLTLAHIHGVLTDTEVDRARNRLLKSARLQQKREPQA